MINCLSRNVVERTTSYKYDRVGSPKKNHRLCCLKIVERSWSGNLSPPRYEQVVKEEKEDEVMGKERKKIRHRRYNSDAAALLGANGELMPKLMRSSGMRRDWSFENLQSKIRNIGH